VCVCVCVCVCVSVSVCVRVRVYPCVRVSVCTMLKRVWNCMLWNGGADVVERGRGAKGKRFRLFCKKRAKESV
jgi:hypothetical protein